MVRIQQSPRYLRGLCCQLLLMATPPVVSAVNWRKLAVSFSADHGDSLGIGLPLIGRHSFWLNLSREDWSGASFVAQ